MKLIIINVIKNGLVTPIFAVAPDIYTELQVYEMIGNPQLDGAQVYAQELGSIDEETLDQFSIASYEAFYPRDWKGKY